MAQPIREIQDTFDCFKQQLGNDDRVILIFLEELFKVHPKLLLQEKEDEKNIPLSGQSKEVGHQVDNHIDGDSQGASSPQ